MHCNLRPPDASPVLIRFNYDAHAKFNVAQPIRCRLIAFSLLIRYVTLWPSPLSVDLWPWTFVVYRLWRDDILYQIWAKSNNPRLSYCELNIRPYNPEHVYHVFRYDLWPMTLTFDPLTLNSCERSSVMWSNYVPHWARLINQSPIGDLAIFLQRGAYFYTLLLRGGPNFTKFWKNRGPPSLHQIGYFGTDALLHFEMRAAQRRVVLKIEAKFHTFDSL